MIKGVVKVLIVLTVMIVSSSGKLPDRLQEGMTVETFLQRVNINDKIVFVYFNADWCVPCIKLKQGILELEKETGAFCEILKMDVDENPLVATHFEINTLPMFMIYKKGKCVWKHTGFLIKPELSVKINLYK